MSKYISVTLGDWKSWEASLVITLGCFLASLLFATFMPGCDTCKPGQVLFIQFFFGTWSVILAIASLLFGIWTWGEWIDEYRRNKRGY